MTLSTAGTVIASPCFSSSRNGDVFSVDKYPRHWSKTDVNGIDNQSLKHNRRFLQSYRLQMDLLKLMEVKNDLFFLLSHTIEVL